MSRVARFRRRGQPARIATPSCRACSPPGRRSSDRSYRARSLASGGASPLTVVADLSGAPGQGPARPSESPASHAGAQGRLRRSNTSPALRSRHPPGGYLAFGLCPASGFELEEVFPCHVLIRRKRHHWVGAPVSSMVNDPEDQPKCRDMGSLYKPRTPSTSTLPRFGWERPRSARTKVLLPAAEAPEGDELIGNDREVGAIEGRDGRGGIAHGRVEEPDLSGWPLRDGGLLRPDVDRLISERLDSPISAANGRQLGPNPGGSDDRRGKPHRDEVERAKLPEGDLLLDDKGGALCEKTLEMTLIALPVVSCQS